MEQRAFHKASMDYVFRLQEVQERKKFEFVETVSVFLTDSNNYILTTYL